MYTTLGAPSGAVDGSKGARSGTESLMSALIVPLSTLLIGFPPCGILGAGPGGLRPGRVTRQLAEQLGLGGAELLVAQRALLMQFIELVELVEHGRLRRRWWRWRLLILRRGLLILRRGLLVLLLLLLLLKVCDALVLIGLRARRLFPLPAECLPTAYAVPPTAAARSNGRRRLNMTCLLRPC